LPGLRASGRTRRIVRLLLALFAAVIVVDALVGDQGLIAMRQARREHAALVSAIAKQRAENAALAEQVNRLTHDPGTIEALARRNLGFIRPGEKVFIVKDLLPHSRSDQAGR
jgi:cell division protein FtsB